MARRKGHYQGKKSSGDHTTVTPFAQKVVNFAHKIKEVKKINPNWINAKASSAQPKLKFEAINGGIRIKAFGSCSMQILLLSTDDPAKVQQALEEGLRDRKIK